MLNRNLIVKQAAERLAVSEQSVYHLCAEGKLTHLRIGIRRGTIRIPEECLDAFVARSTIQANVRTSEKDRRKQERKAAAERS